MNYNDYKDELKEALKNKPSKEEIILFVEKYTQDFPKYALSIRKATFSFMKDTHTVIALEIIEPVLVNIDDPKFLNVVKNRYKEIGDLENLENLEKRWKSINKRKIVNEIIDTFMDNKKVHGIEFAFKELDVVFSKYYYLERTILKKIHTKIKKDNLLYAQELEQKIREKFNDNEFKPTY